MLPAKSFVKIVERLYRLLAFLQQITIPHLLFVLVVDDRAHLASVFVPIVAHSLG